MRHTTHTNTRRWTHTAVISRRYVAFDFHKECSRMRWHRLQILVDTVAEMQDEFGYDVCLNVLYLLVCFS